MTNERFMELLGLVDAVNRSDKFHATIARTKDLNRLMVSRSTGIVTKPFYDIHHFYDIGAAQTSDHVFTFGDTDLKQGEAALRKMLEEVRDGV